MANALTHAEAAVQPDWWRTMVMYELSIKSFADGDGDGIGDFRGATAHLDYLRSLGVDCVWLLPFNPSPGKDDGYDVADYYNVHPQYGSLEDLRAFLDEAHARKIRVIMDLVINHTSDQHAWFQEARSIRTSPKRNWYMWSNTPDKYAQAKICFPSVSNSNWEWDEAAGEYYWHRFFKHQPDLNFDNPEVHEAVFDIVRFWLGLGIDGFRLDAIPHLYAREGTSCDSLPETHAFLADLRALVDSEFGGDRLLLAEAQCWPEEVVEYFGTATRPECHMCFNFPVMARVFSAIRRGTNEDLIRILNETPPTSIGQWGVFLRNHDHITLDAVDVDERELLLATYAPENAMRINDGIRRRLAPMLENDRRKILLANSIILTLPGSPVLYYGDEIGMGDNVNLQDRDGLRTPMQWNNGLNGGFSTAKTVYPPVVNDGVFGYQLVNVVGQMSDPASLLNAVRQLLHVRKAHPVFGTGSFSLIACESPQVFAFIRNDSRESILCIHNLSGHSVDTVLQIPNSFDDTARDLIANVDVSLAQGDFVVSLGPHEFKWVKLEDQEQTSQR